MASISQLQKAIDERRIDTRQLNPEQLQALDQSFKEGELSGYDSVKDYARIIDLASTSVAAQKQKRMEGFAGATGIERGDFVLAGAAGMAMVPYFKNRDQLMDAFVKNGFKDRFGVDTRYNSLGQIYKNRFTVLQDSLKKLPRVRGIAGLPIRMLKSTAKMVDNTVDFFSKTLKFGASPALATEAQSLLYGATGAGVGSGVYGIANLGTDFVAATSSDMADLTDNDIRKLPFAQRELVIALNEAKNDLLWAGGAMSLIPLVRFAGREGVKASLGLNSEQSKVIARSFERLGVKPNIAALIPGENAFQNFFKKFFTTIGVYPLVTGPLAKYNKEFNRNLTQEQFLNAVDNLNLAPSSNLSIMNYAGANQMRHEWGKVLEAIEQEYDSFRKIYQEIGNPKFIPTQTIKQETNRLLNQLKEMYPEEYNIWTSLEKGARDLTDIDDPLVQYIKYLNSSAVGNHIRLSDWQGLSRMQTNAYMGTKFKGVKPTILVIRNALEKDLNSLNEATVRSNLKNDIFKKEYSNLLETQGPQAAEAFLDTQIRTANQAFSRLKEANSFYSLVLRPYQKSKVSRQLRRMDSKLFADAGIDITGLESIAADEVFDKVIRRVMAGDSPDAVRQLKQILGVTKSSYDIIDEATGKIKRTVQIPTSPESKAVYDRYVKQFFWDAWNEATERPLRDLQSLSSQAIAAQAAKQGLMRKRLFSLDDSLEQKVRAKTRLNETLDVTEVDGRIFTRSNIANLNDGVIRNHDFGDVDMAKFIKNLGLDTPQGKDKIREIFGGGAQGQKALDRIEDIIRIKSAVDLVDYTDPSKFVQRSLTLRAGSTGGIAAGATAAAFGIGSTLKLVLGGRLLGSVLVNPKLAEDLMDLNQYMRFMSDDSNVRSLSPQLAPRAGRTWARFINSLMEAEGDDFRVDPNNIDFEEVRQKILSLDPNIPLSNSYDFGSMPKFTRDRIYPEYDVAKTLPPETARAGEEFLQGANLIALSDQQFDQAANSEPMVQSTEPATMAAPTTTQPATMATPQMSQDTGQRAAQYASLFPQDVLGQAVVNRPQQFNEGGFVEDVYNQADEVLNA